MLLSTEVSQWYYVKGDTKHGLDSVAFFLNQKQGKGCNPWVCAMAGVCDGL
jgi:hypothetical protein